jgi:hypothetical protein
VNEMKNTDAAPELYAALKGMVEMFCDLVKSGDEYWSAEAVDEVIAARAALAKAEGK